MEIYSCRKFALAWSILGWEPLRGITAILGWLELWEVLPRPWICFWGATTLLWFCEWQRDPVCDPTLIVCVEIILQKSLNSLVFGIWYLQFGIGIYGS